MIQKYKWGLYRWGAGFLNLYLSRRLRKGRKHRPVDVILIDSVMRGLLRQPNVQPFSSEERARYESVVSETTYWHGTGRLQHDKSGGVVDVLRLLAEQNGLRPFKDIFDVKQGEMVSTSITRDRMYARIYADMHVFRGVSLDERYGSPRFWSYKDIFDVKQGEMVSTSITRDRMYARIYADMHVFRGVSLDERYGSPRFWSYYFLAASFLYAVGELRLWHPRTRKAQKERWVEQGKKVWTVKVTKQDGDSIGQFFNTGSDIQGNYPILIGIKRGDYNFLETAAYVARYESRVGSGVPMGAFTHLEVPAAHVVEVREFLQKYRYNDLPVFAFEQCESWWARGSFSKLVGGESSNKLCNS